MEKYSKGMEILRCDLKTYMPDAIQHFKDAVALDSYLLKMINRARREKGLSLIDSVDGRTPEGHPNASFLHIASENHELGSMSQDNIQSYDLSASPEQYNLPTLQKSLSLISEVRRTKDAYQVHVFLDNSKRNHSIDSRIENMRGKFIRLFKTLAIKS
jgi:hypothetical protein